MHTEKSLGSNRGSFPDELNIETNRASVAGGAAADDERGYTQS